jgi:hypothetical protein
MEIVKGIMKELSDYKDVKDIPKLLKRIYEIDKEHKLGIKISEQAQKFSEIFEKSPNISLGEASLMLKKILEEKKKAIED